MKYLKMTFILVIHFFIPLSSHFSFPLLRILLFYIAFLFFLFQLLLRSLYFVFTVLQFHYDVCLHVVSFYLPWDLLCFLNEFWKILMRYLGLLFICLCYILGNLLICVPPSHFLSSAVSN